MHQSVIDAFPLKYSAPLEGYRTNPYLDEKGLVTVGIGCLIDPVRTALGLEWQLPDGSPATDDEVVRQLSALKAQVALAHYSAASPTVLDATTIRLTDAGVIALATRRLLAGEPLMRKAFASWGYWPADAQLFACSLGWAIGFGWPAIFSNCAQALRAGKFALCAEGNPAMCDIDTKGNPGIIPRNTQNRLLLTNAQVVADRALDVSVLHWPKSPLNDGTANV